MGTFRTVDDDFGRRAEDFFEREIAARIPAGDPYRVVAIHVESGDFEVGDDVIAVEHLLRARHPDALFWFRRVGFPWLHRMPSRRHSRHLGM